MEIKNVLVVLAGALVLTLIVSLAVVGNFKGSGYAVGDTVKTPVIYEGAVREFVIGQFAHRIVVRDVDSSGAVYFELDGSEKYRIIKGETIQLVGRILVPSQSNDFDVTLLYTGKNIFGREYAVFQVTEVAVVRIKSQCILTEESAGGLKLEAICDLAEGDTVIFIDRDND